MSSHFYDLISIVITNARNFESEILREKTQDESVQLN